jgi:hypothetical protein
LPVNTNITFKLRAVNAYGESQESALSKATSFKLFVPARPVVTSVTTTMNTARVNFTKPAINGSEIITYKYSLNGGNYVNLNSAVIPFSVPIENNVANNIQIIATNAVGDSVPSLLLTRTFSFVYLTPLAPRITSITGSNQCLIVNFNTSTIRGAPVTSYSYSIDNGVTIVDSGTTVSPLTIPNLINNTSYTVTLYANSILGLSAVSNAIVAKPILAAPGIPVIASNTPKNNSCILTLQPAVINGSPITTYLYSINGSTTFTNSNQNASPITINGLVNGTTYVFRLIAVNAIGNSVVSLPVTITPIYTIPSAPVITRVTPGTGRLTVTFTASNPNGGTLSGYYYSFDNGSSKIKLTPLGNTLTINSLSRNQSYTVTLFSENELGFSQSSNSMTATTR